MMACMLVVLFFIGYFNYVDGLIMMNCYIRKQVMKTTSSLCMRSLMNNKALMKYAGADDRSTILPDWSMQMQKMHTKK